MPLVGDRLKARREEIVLEHVDAENARDYERALATFDHPRYEFVATDDVYDGAEEVMALTRGQGFGAESAWKYVTWLTIGYMVARGIAKSGSREHYDAS